MSAENPHQRPDDGRPRDNSRRQYKKPEGGSELPQHIEKKIIPEHPTEEERLQIARAIIERQYREYRWIKAVIGRETGQQDFEESSPRSQETKVEQMELTLKDIDETNSPPTTDSFLQRYFETVDDWALNEGFFSTEGAFERLEAMKMLTRRRSNVHETLTREYQKLPLTYHLAIELAHEWGTSPADIFEDDELYKRFVKRRYQTPAEHAQDFVEDINRITPDIVSELSEINILSEAFQEGRPLNEMQEEIEAKKEDPQTTASIDQQTAMEREMRRIEARASLKRFWGKEALQQLDNELQERLEIKDRPSDVALAIVHRARLEKEWKNAILEFESQQQIPNTPDSTQDITNKAKLLDSFLQDTSNDVPGVIDRFITQYTEYHSEEDEVVLSDEAKTLLARQKQAQRKIMGEDEIEFLLKSTQKAQEIAQRRNIPLESVYQEDHLYAELIREAYQTPQHYAEVKLAHIETLTPEMYTELDIVTKIAQRAATGENIDGYEDAFRAVPEAPEIFEQKTQEIKQLHCRLVHASLREFWGEGAIQELDPETRTAFEIKKSPGEEIEDVRLHYLATVKASVMTQFPPHLQEQAQADEYIGDLLNQFVKTSGQQAEFEWRVQAIPTAQEIAQEHNTDLLSVYDDLDLFVQLQRAYFSPETYADVGMKKIEQQFSPENSIEYAVLYHLLTEAAQGSSLDGEEERVRDYCASEEGKADINHNIEQKKSESLRNIDAKIDELWGDSSKETTPKPAERVKAREYTKRVTALWKENKFSESLPYMERVIELTPDDADAWGMLGETQRALEQWGNAAEAYEKAFALASEKEEIPASIYRHYGDVLEELGRDEEAISALSKAVEQEPENHYTWWLRGHLHTKFENYEQAIADHTQAITLDETNEHYRESRSDVYYEMHEYEKASEDLSHAMQLRPDEPRYIYNYGYLQTELGNYEVAEENVTKAIELAPEKALYRAQLGEIQYKRGNYDGAEQNLQQAIEMDETDPEPHYYLALTQEALGTTEAVRDLLEKAQTLAQEQQEDYQELLEQIQTKLQGM